MKLSHCITLVCCTMTVPLTAPAQISNFWTKVDTVTAGDCDDLNPSITHSVYFSYPGDFTWVVFERHTSTESQIAARKFNRSTSKWDSSVVVLSSRPPGEEQEHPDYSDCRYYDTSTSIHIMRLAAWQVRKYNRWQIFYSTFSDGTPFWSAPSALVNDSLDNTCVRVRPLLDTAFIVTWKRGKTVMWLMKSLSTTTPAETLAVSNSDSLEYDISLKYGVLGVIWTSDVLGKMTPLYRQIITYPQIQLSIPETLQVAVPCFAPHMTISPAADPTFLFETQELGKWDVFYCFNYWYPSFGSISGDSLSDNHNAWSFNLPVITKPAARSQTYIPSSLGLVVYEKTRGKDSCLVFAYGFQGDTIRSPGHNWNARMGSQPFVNQTGQNVLVVWESNRSGRAHIYSRIVHVYMDAIEPRTEQPFGYQLLQNYPNPFNPSTTIRYALPARSYVSLTVFNTLGQEVAAMVNTYQGAGYHEVRFDGSGLASGVYFYRLRAGEYGATRRLILIR
jgi:hypothetical protein